MPAFALAALALWRITHLLHAEDGPGGVLIRLRAHAGATLGCFFCASLILAAPLALALGGIAWRSLLLWPALSGAACLLERATERAMPFIHEEIAE